MRGISSKKIVYIEKSLEETLDIFKNSNDKIRANRTMIGFIRKCLNDENRLEIEKFVDGYNWNRSSMIEVSRLESIKLMLKCSGKEELKDILDKLEQIKGN